MDAKDMQAEKYMAFTYFARIRQISATEGLNYMYSL